MSIYLNTDTALKNYNELAKSKYFIDKSNILKKLNTFISTPNKYICITKPRRFGKSSIINMLGAYYTKGYNVEFKVRVPLKVRELTEEICAFANADGGYLLIGVDDNGQIVLEQDYGKLCSSSVARANT